MSHNYRPLLALSIVVGAVVVTVTPGYSLGQDLSPINREVLLAQALDDKASPEPCSDSDTGLDEWLYRERIVILSGEVEPSLAERVIAQLLYLNSRAPGKEIYLYINTVGGDITSGMAIYDTMQAIQSPVVTVSFGEASSMGSFLLAGGVKGKRVALPNARIMIHQPLSRVSGQASDVAIAAKEILYLKSLLNRLLSEFTGQALRRIEIDTDRDFYMSATEAKNYGLIDQVVRQLPSASRPLK